MSRTSRRLVAMVGALGVAAGVLVAAPVAQAAAPTDPLPSAALTGGPYAFGAATTVEVSWTNVNSPTSVTIASSATVPSSATGTCRNALPTANGAASCTYIGLTVGQPYVFTITASNADGTASGNSAPVTPVTKPAAPSIVASTNGNDYVWVDWSVPNNGGDPITSYDVYVDGTVSTATGCYNTTNTDCILDDTNVPNGASYAITVTATNGEGESAASAVRTVTPSPTSGIPGAPTGVTATQVDNGGNKDIQVAFTPPTAVAGFPFEAFTATCTSATPGAATPITNFVGWPVDPVVIDVPGGTNAATYTCTVTAGNLNGTSAASSASNAVTINNSDVPGAPTLGTVTGGSQQAVLTWTAPSPLPVSPITAYQVQYFATGASAWSSPISTGSTSTSYAVTSLAAGTYVFRVRAVNAGGVSDWSATSALTTVTSGTLGTPTAVTGTPGTSQVSLTWTAPTGGTLSPTSYQVRYSANSGSTWTELAATGTTTTTATISGLTNGTAYIFGVRAINGSVLSDWSTNSTAVTPGAPGVPTKVAGTAGDARVNLTWTAPTGTPTATSYQVQYSSNNGTTWLPATPLAATTTSLTVTGLTNGTAYVFQVRALNGPVTGTYSTKSAPITPVAPVTTTIEIAGERGTGKNKQRIYIDGVTTGLAAGTTVVPQYRLPGQTGFTNGTARPEVDEDGFFTWTRKAGKRIVIRFTTESGDVRSNTVKIPARR